MLPFMAMLIVLLWSVYPYGDDMDVTGLLLGNSCICTGGFCAKVFLKAFESLPGMESWLHLEYFGRAAV